MSNIPDLSPHPPDGIHGRDGHATPITIRQGACLPHWTRDGGIYSVTFRLADSLPQFVLARLIAERDALRAAARKENNTLNAHDLRRLDDLHSEKIEAYLDAGRGSCRLNNPEIAKLVTDALSFFHIERYLLHAWCVMPNHVHVVVEPFKSHPLEKIIHSWKSFTAKEANKILKRSGPFWQAEPFDHLIRDEQDYRHAADYVLSNPDKAGLTNWPWRGMGVPSMNPEPGK